MINKTIAFLLLLLAGNICPAQDTTHIYAFMNKELSEQQVGKSDWGLFFISTPYIIDSDVCKKIYNSEWLPAESLMGEDSSDTTPKMHRPEWTAEEGRVIDEFYHICLQLSIDWQRRFRWQQSSLHNNIIVSDTKHQLSASIVSKLSTTKAKKAIALKWINEWNKTKIEERLVNYSSIPVFSADGNYVFIVRGQDVRSEGGWDSIYIYKKENGRWMVWKEITISQI